MKNLPCPCDPAREYATCCQPLHEGQPANNAEALRACSRALLTFLARYIEAGRHGQMRETSCFVKENGRWLYWDGDY